MIGANNLSMCRFEPISPWQGFIIVLTNSQRGAAEFVLRHGNSVIDVNGNKWRFAC